MIHLVVILIWQFGDYGFSHQIQCKLTLLIIISILHILIINPYPTQHQDSELKDTTYIPKLTLSQVIFK